MVFVAALAALTVAAGVLAELVAPRPFPNFP